MTHKPIKKILKHIKISHQASTNQDHNEIPTRVDIMKSGNSVGEDEGKSELLQIAGGM